MTSLVSIWTIGQCSLSLQLQSADGGLYDFGRVSRLLSTVIGIPLPPHNFIAVYKRIVHADPLLLLSYLSLLFLAMVLFQQVVHSTWQNAVCNPIWVHQFFARFRFGQTEAVQERR